MRYIEVDVDVQDCINQIDDDLIFEEARKRIKKSANKKAGQFDLDNFFTTDLSHEMDVSDAIKILSIKLKLSIVDFSKLENYIKTNFVK